MIKTITWEDFNGDDAVQANRLEDYYLGKQNQYVEAMLGKQRDDWKARGFIVESRNIVGMIITNSGPLMNKPPVLSIVPYGANKGIPDAKFNQIMEGANWLPVFQNVDAYTRLFGSVIVVQQKYVPEGRMTVDGAYQFDASKGDALKIDFLHVGNSVVKMDKLNRNIAELAFLTTDYSNCAPWSYRYINSDVIEDYTVDGDKETLDASVENTEGIVPASPFYDTRTPARGIWNNIPEDLLNIQDKVNLFNVDMTRSIAYQQQKTFFTDSDIVDSGARNAGKPTMGHPGIDGASSSSGTQGQGFKQASQSWTKLTESKKSIGGLGSMVRLRKDSTDGSSPMVKFDGPTTDVMALYNVVALQVRDVAADWCVTVKASDSQKANSGFQVIVEENDNMQLREKRAQSFQAGFKRFYGITQVLYPELQEGMLTVEFAAPALPVDPVAEQTVWAYMIANNFATPVDFFMKAQSMTKEDAMTKLHEVIAINKLIATELGPTKPIVLPHETDPAQKGGNPKQPTLPV
jgi:hypothetical protein